MRILGPCCVVALLLFSVAISAAETRSDAGVATLAFPGAEGFGRFAEGGRGGRVIKVTNLRDDGPGSLRKALQAKGPRTIVFDVSGYIDLKRNLDINNGYVTVAGQTAPGDGVTLRGYALVIKADQVIVRYIRVRPGASAGVETDAISVSRGKNIIVDHCSTSWATDETLSISPSTRNALRTIDNVTVQWSLIAESLNDSVHSKGPHGYGTLMRGSGGARYSLRHNLWAHHRARMPRPGNYFDRETDSVGPLFEVSNNVFYNWSGNYSGYNADVDSLARYDFVANYYLVGPDSHKAVAFKESNPYSSMYFNGNWMNGKPVDDPLDVVMLPGGSTLATSPQVESSISTADATKAFRAVLEKAGASLVRDAVDKRIVGNVRDRSGRIIDDVSDTPGWPALQSLPAPADSDSDGMPDEWEDAVGLNPQDGDDGWLDRDDDGYTNLEEYLNSLVPGRSD